MPILTYILAFVITIGVLVTVHEFGHFMSARIFGMHVPVFSIGMGRRLFGFSKLTGFTFGPLKEEQEAALGECTDYRLSLLPIGGYAKIEGMIDETQTAELSPIVHPWEFRAKPWWQKSIVICAGVIMNLFIASLIFTGLALRNGETRVATLQVGYVYPHSVPAMAGIRAGDSIVSVGGVTVADWTGFEDRLTERYLGSDCDIVFKTPQGLRTVHYPALNLNDIPNDELGRREMAWMAVLPFGYGRDVIDSVVEQPAKSAGLRSGDIVTTLNGDTVGDENSLVTFIHSHPKQAITLTWLRDRKTEMSATVTPDSTGRIGVVVGDLEYYGPFHRTTYNVVTAVPVGVREGYRQLKGLVLGIWSVVVGKLPAGKALGGPIKIFQLAGKSASLGGERFLEFIAALSLSLAFINILPIPALDGGHLIIILIEAVLKRELSQKFKLGVQRVGVALLLSLMVFMVFNDLRNL